ncbi:MAG: serine/threonine dehydratase, partial [Pseudomonadota bacterium]
CHPARFDSVIVSRFWVGISAEYRVSMLSFSDVQSARQRIRPHVVETPVVSSRVLNEALGHEIFFKAECLQRIGAFKARGACNALRRRLDAGETPRNVVAQSSGNHAQATAWAAARFGIPATIVMPRDVSRIKAQATRAYGATADMQVDRATSELRIRELAAEPGTLWVHPYDDADVIAGQGTATLEALETTGPVDLVAGPCGGGGLMGGAVLAAGELSPTADLIGVEPAGADDAAQSLRAGHIVTLPASPDTLADGVRTLSIGELNFALFSRLAGIEVVSDERICYWTQWLSHLLKLHLEPTAALGMAGAANWLRGKDPGQRVLVLLSGGNVDAEVTRRVWSTNYLDNLPSLDVGLL